MFVWAKKVHDSTTDTTSRRFAQEIITWLNMPQIIAALQFEAAIGEYFNTTSDFHYSPGELTKHSGFRMFEMHMFWFRYISPWWESALNEPRNHFSPLYHYLNANFSAEAKKLKENQIQAGIAAGYNELMKMSKLLFAPPVIFLILVDPC